MPDMPNAVASTTFAVMIILRLMVDMMEVDGSIRSRVSCGDDCKYYLWFMARF